MQSGASFSPSGICGAIIAGGQSRRFGSDKAVALLQGRPLIEHVIDELLPQCETVVICGRVWGDNINLADRPGPDMGPLGGLCAALQFAREQGYDFVLSAPCDVLPVACVSDLIKASNDPHRARYVSGNYLSGLWPAALGPALDMYVESNRNPSMRQWISHCGALPVTDPRAYHNFNTEQDLRDYEG